MGFPYLWPVFWRVRVLGREDSGDAKKNTRDHLAVQTLFINLHPGCLLFKVMCFFANSSILIHNLGNLLVIYWFLSKLFHHVSPQIHQSDFRCSSRTLGITSDMDSPAPGAPCQQLEELWILSKDLRVPDYFPVITLW